MLRTQTACTYSQWCAGAEMSRDFMYGVFAGLGISTLGGGLYWLVQKMREVRL